MLPIFTSAEEVMYSSDSVHVFVCVSVQNISKSCKQILMKFSGEMEHGPGRNQPDFGGDPGSFADPGLFPGLLPLADRA